jgi:hypothetical protein
VPIRKLQTTDSCGVGRTTRNSAFAYHARVPVRSFGERVFARVVSVC